LHRDQWPTMRDHFVEPTTRLIGLGAPAAASLTGPHRSIALHEIFLLHRQSDARAAAGRSLTRWQIGAAKHWWPGRCDRDRQPRPASPFLARYLLDHLGGRQRSRPSRQAPGGRKRRGPAAAQHPAFRAVGWRPARYGLVLWKQSHSILGRAGWLRVCSASSLRDHAIEQTGFADRIEFVNEMMRGRFFLGLLRTGRAPERRRPGQ